MRHHGARDALLHEVLICMYLCMSCCHACTRMKAKQLLQAVSFGSSSLNATVATSFGEAVWED